MGVGERGGDGQGGGDEVFGLGKLGKLEVRINYVCMKERISLEAFIGGDLEKAVGKREG